MSLNVGELQARITANDARFKRTLAGAKAAATAWRNYVERQRPTLDANLKPIASKIEKTTLALGGLAPAAAAAGSGIALGVGAGFIGFAAAAQHNNAAVQESFHALASDVLVTSKQITTGAVPELVDAGHAIQGTFDRLAPSLQTAVDNSMPYLSDLTSGVDRLASDAMPGLLDITASAGPIFASTADLMGTVGQSTGDMMSTIADHTGELSTGLDVFGQVVDSSMHIATSAIVGLGQVTASQGGTIEATLQGVEGVVTGLASGALPALGSSLGVFLTMANGVLAIIGPISSELGAMTGYIGPLIVAFRGIRPVSGWLTKMSGKLDTVAGRLDTAASGAGRLGGRLSGLRKGASTGVSALSKLGRVMSNGGILGLALAGVGLLLTELGKKQEEAAAAARDHAQTVDALASALGQSGGAITANVRKLTAQKLATSDNAKTLQQYGVSLNQVTSTVLEGHPAIQRNITDLQRQKQHLQASIKTHYMWSGSGRAMHRVLDATGQKLKEQLGHVEAQIGAWKGLDGTLEEATSKQQKLSNAIKSTGDRTLWASSVASQLSGAWGILNDATASLDDQLKALQLDLKLMSESGMEAANDYTGKFMLTLKQLSTQVKGFQGPALQLNEVLGQTSARGAQVAQKIEAARNQWAGYAQNAINAGKTSDQVQTHLQGLRNKLVTALLPAFNGNRRAVEQLLAKMGLVPSNITTEVTTPGAVASQKAMDILRGKVLDVPNSHTVVTSALTGGALAALHNLGFTTRTLPNGNVAVTASTGAANAAFRRLYEAWNGTFINMYGVVHYSSHPPSGGGVNYNATGGILRPFAGGGFYNGHELTPMAGGTAELVPSDTWRVIGDNMQVTEAYIPLNPNSQRSQHILDQALQVMRPNLAQPASGSRAAVVTAREHTTSAAAGAAGGVGVDELRDALAGMEFVLDDRGGRVMAKIVNRANRELARR